jgi:hypothetical protein
MQIRNPDPAEIKDTEKEVPFLMKSAPFSVPLQDKASRACGNSYPKTL